MLQCIAVYCSVLQCVAVCGDENVQRHRHLSGCAHHRRGAGWRRDSPVDSSYHHLEALAVPFACAFCVGPLCAVCVCLFASILRHTYHTHHTTHHAPHAPHAPRTTHHTYTHARLEASAERAMGGSWPRGRSSPSRSRSPTGRARHRRPLRSRTSGSRARTGNTSSSPAGCGSPPRGSVSATLRPASRSGTCRGQTTSGPSTRLAGRATGRTTPP